MTAKPTTTTAVKGFDWGALFAQIWPLLLQLLSNLKPKPMTGTYMKTASECSDEDCCNCLLAVQAQIFQDAIYFHQQTMADKDATQEAKDHAECLLCCAAHGVLYAIKLHQSCCCPDEPVA